MKRPAYVLTVRAEPGVDEVRSLRALLKAMRRTYGLRCIEIQEGNQQRRTKMDMRKYASKSIKPDQVRDGPVRARIVDVFEDELRAPNARTRNRLAVHAQRRATTTP